MERTLNSPKDAIGRAQRHIPYYFHTCLASWEINAFEFVDNIFLVGMVWQ